MRIHVGGLGANVQEDEIKKIFGTPQLGVVNSVEIIRSKGRSFAYFEFDPASEKGLTMLFNKYNGCMWKGGRLRLEKAKEHYMDRLKREWAQDAELQKNMDEKIVDVNESTEKPKKGKEFEGMQLKIYFPKLRKIKPVPFKGTGKHKYSFQRFEYPLLPVYFCDCEEHCPSLEVRKSDHTDENLTENYGMNEDEMNMMKSVLGKLLGRDSIPAMVPDKDESKEQINNEGVASADNGDNHRESEDNFVINIVDQSSKRVDPLDNWRAKRATVAQVHPVISEEVVNKSSDIRARKKAKLLSEKQPGHENLSTNFVSPQRKQARDVKIKISEKLDAQLVNSEANSGKNSHSLGGSNGVPEKTRFDKGASTAFRVSDILRDENREAEVTAKSDSVPTASSSEVKENHKDEEPENKSDLQSKKPSTSQDNHYARGKWWKHERSWLELVSSANTSFSISQVLADREEKRYGSE